VTLRSHQKLLLAIATNAALLGAAELGARVFLPAPPKPKETPVQFVGNDPNGRFPTEWNDDLFWSIPPKAQIPDIVPAEYVNSYGFRGPEFAEQKPSGKKRLVLLGDSNTFGMNAGRYDNYPHRLRRWFATDPQTPWEIVNTATPGYSAFQMLQMLRTRARRYSPDVVVLYAGAWNDYTPAIGYDDPTSYQLFQSMRESHSGFRLRKLRVFELFSDSMKPAVASNANTKKEEYKRLWSDKIERPDGPRVPQQKFRDVLTAIARESKAVGAKVIFIVPPAPTKTRERFTEGTDYARIVAEVGTKEADKVIDARTPLSLPEELDAKVFSGDIIHPGALGHAVLAKLVAEALLELKLDGLPTAPTMGFVSPPVSLGSRLANAQFEVGEPLAPFDAKEAARLGDGHLIALPSPYRVRAEKIPVPLAASLELELTFFTRKEFTPAAMESMPAVRETVGPIDFELRVECDGMPPKVLLHESVSSSNVEKWAPIGHHQVDFSDYGGKEVTLVFECHGNTVRAVWGALTFDSYR
jgi:lysophospholipase L1-like esterase